MSHDAPTAVVKVKEADRTKDWQGCGETEPPQVPGGNIQWYSHSRKQFGSFLKELDIYLPFSLFSHSVVSNSLQSHGLQHARPPLSFTIPQSLLKTMSIESVMPWHDAMPSSVIPFSFAFTLSQNQGLF